MKAKRRILSLLSLLASATGLFAANHVVQVGEKIQDAINAAADGDVIIVRDGLHVDQGAIVVAKHVRLVREKDADVIIRGTSLTFRDLNQSTVLRDFRIENSVTIEDCKQFGIEDVDLSINGGGREGNLDIYRSNVVIRTSQIRHIPTCNDSSLEVIGSTLTYDLNGARNTLQVVDTTFRRSVQTDTNCTFVNTTASAETSTFTRGRFVSHGATFGSSVIFETCDWVSHGSTFKSNLRSRRSHTKLLRSSVAGTLYHEQKTAGTNPDYSLDCVVFQSYVGTLTSVAKRTWVAYSTIRSATIGADTEEAHFVGNSLDSSGITADSTSLDLVVNNNRRNDLTLRITSGPDPARQDKTTRGTHGTSWQNFKTFTFTSGTYFSTVSNQIYNEHTGSSYETDCFMRFYYADGSNSDSNTNTQTVPTWVTKTYNNPQPLKEVISLKVYLRQRDNHDSTEAFERYTFTGGSDAMPLTVTHAKSVRILNNSFLRVSIAGDFGGTVEIKGNVFWNPVNEWPSHAISAPAPGLSQDNYFQNSGKTATGGINNDFNIVGGDPGFVDAANGNFSLKPDSRLKDKGPAEAQFNDHDGSRNDIGHFGGHAYDVNGSTSVNPVILSGEQTPFRIRLGENTPIQIKARAAVVTPDE